MRRLLSVLLLLVAVALSACAPDDDGGDGPSPQPEPADGPISDTQHLVRLYYAGGGHINGEVKGPYPQTYAVRRSVDGGPYERFLCAQPFSRNGTTDFADGRGNRGACLDAIPPGIELEPGRSYGYQVCLEAERGGDYEYCSRPRVMLCYPDEELDPHVKCDEAGGPRDEQPSEDDDLPH